VRTSSTTAQLTTPGRRSSTTRPAATRTTRASSTTWSCRSPTRRTAASAARSKPATFGLARSGSTRRPCSAATIRWIQRNSRSTWIRSPRGSPTTPRATASPARRTGRKCPGSGCLATSCCRISPRSRAATGRRWTPRTGTLPSHSVRCSRPTSRGCTSTTATATTCWSGSTPPISGSRTSRGPRSTPTPRAGRVTSITPSTFHGCRRCCSGASSGGSGESTS